ncbi:hypothetical protein DFH27DRAFT_548830 [Peziza echinospora]|nr:hypothetical protein DFH27DRAFT_548830 [Peziza echinospora]
MHASHPRKLPRHGPSSPPPSSPAPLPQRGERAGTTTSTAEEEAATIIGTEHWQRPAVCRPLPARWEGTYGACVCVCVCAAAVARQARGTRSGRSPTHFETQHSIQQQPASSSSSSSNGPAGRQSPIDEQNRDWSRTSGDRPRSTQQQLQQHGGRRHRRDSRGHTERD